MGREGSWWCPYNGYRNCTSDSDCRCPYVAVVPALSDFAGDPQAIRLGVMSNGKVHVDHGDGWIYMKTGQRQLEMPITDIDEVFQPFEYGGGKVVPLLNASENTTLHPTVLHGAPRLKGHRVSAKALAGYIDGVDVNRSYGPTRNWKTANSMIRWGLAFNSWGLDREAAVRCCLASELREGGSRVGRIGPMEGAG